jgi:hypothetical protein
VPIFEPAAEGFLVRAVSNLWAFHVGRTYSLQIARSIYWQVVSPLIWVPLLIACLLTERQPLLSGTFWLLSLGVGAYLARVARARLTSASVNMENDLLRLGYPVTQKPDLRRIGLYKAWLVRQGLTEDRVHEAGQMRAHHSDGP